MSGLYLETSAVRKLTDYNYNGNVYTSAFVLFELISGIKCEAEFLRRKACIKRILDQKITIKPKMVDQIFCELFDAKGYEEDFSFILFRVAHKITILKNFDEFAALKVPSSHENPIIDNEQKSLLSWLKYKDDLLYLEEGDVLFSADKIYNIIDEYEDNFHLVKIKNEKSVSELVEKRTCVNR